MSCMSTNTRNLRKGKANTTWQVFEQETCPSGLLMRLLQEHMSWSTLKSLGIPNLQVTMTGTVPVPVCAPWDKPCLGGWKDGLLGSH